MEDSFGQLLRRYRLAAGLTQESLAARARLSSQAVGALERGDRRRPYRHTVDALAGGLDLDEAELVRLLAAARPPGRPRDQAAIADTASRPPAPPRQLPAAPCRFTGRDAELARLVRALTGPTAVAEAASTDGAPVIDPGAASVAPAGAVPGTASAADTSGTAPSADASGTAVPAGQDDTAPAAAGGTASSAGPDDAAPGADADGVNSLRSNGVPVVAVTGMGGVGKTALVLRAAHAVAEHYPDGQIYLDLRGSAEPLDTRAAMTQLLRSIAGPAGTGTGADTPGAYRSVLAGRRVLLVLDNASGTEQVADLLPGTAGCAAIVAGRGVLDQPAVSLHMRLEALSESASRSLLRAMVGPERLTAEPEATAAVVGNCAGLPLALQLAGSRLAARPRWPIAHLAERLTDQLRRLDALERRDSGVRACFAASTELLDAAGKRGFASLGILAGGEFSVELAARLLDTSEAAAERLLERFTDLALLDATGPGAYRIHDLLHDFAREQADALLPASERDAAWARVAELLVSAAWRSLWLAQPDGLRNTWGPSDLADHAPSFAGSAEAFEWLDAHRPRLVEAARAAATPPRLRVLLSLGLLAYYLSRGHLLDWVAVAESAATTADEIEAAVRAAATDRTAAAASARDAEPTSATWATDVTDRAAMAASARDAEPISATGTDDSAGRAAAADAVRAAATTDDSAPRDTDPTSAAATYDDSAGRAAAADAVRAAATKMDYGMARCDLAAAWGGDPEPGVELMHHGLKEFRDLGDHAALAVCLINMAATFLRIDRLEPARECAEEALALSGEVLGSRAGQAAAAFNLGTALGRLGDVDRQLAHYRRSLGLIDPGNDLGRAEVLRGIGTALHRAGEPGAAAETLREAAELSATVGDLAGRASALTELGVVLLDSGEPGPAVVPLREALAVAVDIGDVLRAERIRSLLAQAESDEPVGPG